MRPKTRRRNAFRRTACVWVMASMTFAHTAWSNDTTANLGTKGLTFVCSDNVEMVSEDLFVSKDEIQITYGFRNNGKTDEEVLVAFPMPDIEGSLDFMVNVPSDDPENLFDFSTSVDGKPVSAELHQYAFSAGIEQTDILRANKIPLAPYLQATQEAVDALDDTTKQEMTRLGLLQATEFEDQGRPRTDYIPIWTLRSTYSWKAKFPAGKLITVHHRYKPSVGSTNGVTFMGGDESDIAKWDEYTKKYCLGDDIVAKVKASGIKEKGWTNYPYSESWISYIWSTGANWAGTIGRFSLTVDKGDPKNLVSFCGDGVEKIGPTRFRMEAQDWSPPWDRELEILLLEPPPVQ